MNRFIGLALFLMIVPLRPIPAYGMSGDDLENFNRTVDREVEIKMQESEKAKSEGDHQEAYRLYREATFLAALKVEEDSSDVQLVSLKDQLSDDEKKSWIQRLMREGDRLVSLGYYDLAVDEYEKVFLLDYDNPAASKQIDNVKRQFLKEQHQSFKEEGKSIDRELKQRAELLIDAANELIRDHQYDSARRQLEKVLDLDPKNKKARKLLKVVQNKK